MQIDPLAYDDEMNLYLYTGADPVVLVDPSGREKTVYHYSNGQTVIVQTFSNQTQFTNAQISAQGNNLSGVGTNGKLTVTLVPGSDPTALQLKTNPNLQDLNNPNPLTRSHTDKIGGRNIEIAPDALPGTPGHEIGHSLRAGDQYKGGIDANGNPVPANVPGPLNIMRNAAGPANRQTVDEIMNGADKEATQIRTCTVTALETQCQ